MNGSNSNLVTVDYTASSNLDGCLARLEPAVGACLHTTSGSNSRSVLQGLAGPGQALVSAHRLIERSGQVDLLYHLDKVCFHVGESIWAARNRRQCDYANEILIAYELECLDSQEPTYQQLDSFAEQLVADGLTLGWRWPYNLYGHYALAVPLGRRSDPVRLNWGGLAGRIYFRAKAAGVGGL